MTRPLKKILNFFSSLRLTLFCLGLFMVLVFVGTLDQVHLGTYLAQKKYFDSFLIYWETEGGLKFPVFPGGLTLGAVLFFNLIAAHATRFRLNLKKSGIVIAHFGLILLLLGQFLTQLLARESQMAIREGGARNYSESARETELAVIDTSDTGFDRVVSVPWARFSRKGATLSPPDLPFALKIREFYPNADLWMRPPTDKTTPSLADRGHGNSILVRPAPVSTADDAVNHVTAFVELLAKDGSLGTWLLSTGLGMPQSVSHQGREFQLALRPTRTYYPFTLVLKDFKHDLYPGTEIPKNFSSLVRLVHPEEEEDRDVLISMNHPLRYEGKTFFQASFAEEDTVSIFQVVENPVWVTPYLACVLVALGLAVQFLTHLVPFVRKRA